MPKPEALDVVPDMRHLSVEDVRSVLVDSDPRLGIDVVVAVAPYVVALLKHENCVPRRREPLRQHRARESGAHDDDIPEFPGLTVREFPILPSFAGWGCIHAMLHRVRSMNDMNAMLRCGRGTIHDTAQPLGPAQRICEQEFWLEARNLNRTPGTVDLVSREVARLG